MNENPRLTEDELHKLQTRIGWRWVWCAALAIALICGMRPANSMEYHRSMDYHTLLKVATCASFTIWAMGAHARGMTRLRNLFVVVAVVFNPLLPIHLKTSWPVLYLLTSCLALASGALGHMEPALAPQRGRSNTARGNAPGNGIPVNPEG